MSKEQWCYFQLSTCSQSTPTCDMVSCNAELSNPTLLTLTQNIHRYLEYEFKENHKIETVKLTQSVVFQATDNDKMLISKYL